MASGPSRAVGAPPPNFTFSTGQTMKDLMGLQNIAAIMDDTTISNTVPPVLTDPNYVPQSNSQPLLVVSIISIILGVIVVSLRVRYSQQNRTTRLLYIEDCL